jgi:hypothetical protein
MDNRIKYIIVEDDPLEGYAYRTESGESVWDKDQAQQFDSFEEAEKVIEDKGWEETWVDVFYEEDDYEEFENKFEPITRDGNPHFNFYGEDLEIVKKHLEEKGSQYVFTLVVEDGVFWLTPGCRIVNREGYILTKNPWEDGEKDFLF